MKIGVFDSGIGGKSVAEVIERSLPAAEVIYVCDSMHVPYSDRPQAEIIELTDRAIQPLLEADCDIIVIACNTATAAAIEFLRSKYPKDKFIGLEPMVKPAAERTKSGKIVVCATPYTLSSERYQRLKQTYATDVLVYEPDCSRWAQLIEEDAISATEIEQALAGPLEEGADVIALACTHYHWIKAKIQQLAGERAAVIDPSEAVVARIRNLID